MITVFLNVFLGLITRLLCFLQVLNSMLNEICRALLEADVKFTLVKKLRENVR